MSQQKVNLFIISTPSQMINAMEFMHHFGIQEEENKIIISCNSPKSISQIKEIGKSFSPKYFVLFSPKSKLIKAKLYNRMPLKLFRLYASKKRILNIIRKNEYDRLILGNYSNFISNYCTQHLNSTMFVLDDGSGSISLANKRLIEIKEGVPVFDHNYKKNALWLVKLIMGFYDYIIPSKFTFFSSYTFKVAGQDELVLNAFNYLKSKYSRQAIDNRIEYFIGSPISEVGYVTEHKEIEMILNYSNKLKDSKLIYVPHRLDSTSKIDRIKESLEILNFGLPIEFALTQNLALPKKIGGFFTSALPNLVEIINNDVLYFSIIIPKHFYLTKAMELRVADVYTTFESIDKIKLLE